MKVDIYADIVFFNGRVITVNQNDDIVTAVAVKGKEIVYVGDDLGIKDYIGEKTRVVDVKGRTLMPGFVEAHSHFMLASILLNDTVIPIDYKICGSIREIKEKIKGAVRKRKPGEWIVLQGYDQNKLEEMRHPNYSDLDEVAPDNPVWCVRADLHTGVCNSAALKIAGWTKESAKDFQKGELDLDESGELTGLVKEEGFGYMNALVSYQDEQLKEAFQLGDEAFLKVGITSVHDAGAYGAQFVKVLQTACLSGDVHVRVYEMIYRMLGKNSIKEFIYEHIKTGLHTGIGNDHYKLGPAKLLIDGSSSAPSCSTKQPYSHNPDIPQIINWTQEEMDQIFTDAHLAGFQMTAHCIGDNAVEKMVNTIEKVLGKYPREDARPRIEHCAMIDEELLHRIKKLGIIPISNPGLVAFNAKDYNRYYGDRVNNMFSCKSYIEKGIISAAGADAPCMDVNPMIGIWGAVQRKDIVNGEECGICQKISVLDAIRMFTINGAYASYDEKIKGSIEVGKLADLIVLEEDILESEPDHIKDILVDQTYVDGQLVYERGE
ncbi:MAG: amidohydrolase [Lachnospira sp.]|nr:amidohydrolase [Lachnospira sp.]